MREKGNEKRASEREQVKREEDERQNERTKG